MFPPRRSLPRIVEFSPKLARAAAVAFFGDRVTHPVNGTTGGRAPGKSRAAAKGLAFAQAARQQLLSERGHYSSLRHAPARCRGGRDGATSITSNRMVRAASSGRVIKKADAARAMRRRWRGSTD